MRSFSIVRFHVWNFENERYKWILKKDNSEYNSYGKKRTVPSSQLKTVVSVASWISWVDLIWSSSSAALWNSSQSGQREPNRNSSDPTRKSCVLYISWLLKICPYSAHETDFKFSLSYLRDKNKIRIFNIEKLKDKKNINIKFKITQQYQKENSDY